MTTDLPLGLKVNPRNPRLVKKLQQLEAYDFDMVTKSCHARYGWTKPKARLAERATKRFFSLAFLDPGSYHIPEVDVDEFWHRMILHTLWYARFCEDIFGEFYHHTPEPDPKNMSATNRARTTQLVAHWFGAEAGQLVLTCTQCRGPRKVAVSTSLFPAPGSLPFPMRRRTLR